jgi:PAS domain S-box-containing protein
VTALRDVSARVQAEERQQRLEGELRQAARHWGQTFDAIDLGIVLADAQARVIRLNRSALAAGWATLADAPGMELATLAAREPWRTLLEVHRQVGESGTSIVAEAHEASSGRAFYVLGSPWFQVEGEPPWRVLTFRDVTEFTRMQAELRQARVMEALGSLVAGVAHEVRNPLFSISATLDAMEATVRSRPPELEEHVALLRSQVGRLTQLTRDLLDYGRPSALHKSPTDLGAVLRRAVRASSTLIRDRRVTVEECVSPDLPRLDLDAARMEQAFENLLANAVQHAPAGSLVRLAAAPAVLSGASFVRCVVEDQGPVLPASGLQQIFEPFFTRRKGGTGLGLAIVRRIVESHGGRIAAENGDTGGARFTVWLPAPGVEGEAQLG